MAILRDVTAHVTCCGPTPDGELLSITKCVCERTFPAWFLIIWNIADHPKELAEQCPCSKLLYFERDTTHAIRVKQLIPQE